MHLENSNKSDGKSVMMKCNSIENGKWKIENVMNVKWEMIGD